MTPWGHRSLLRRNAAARRSPALGLLVLALVGLAFAATDWGDLVVSWSHIRTALGESLIVAAALGLTVDFFYKRELARDAFEASLGYLLPDELKAELRWIYGQQLVGVQYEMLVVLRLLDEDGSAGPRRVRVEFEAWRTLRNVSGERVEAPTFASVEEWFRGEQSDVSEIEWVHRGQHYSGTTLVSPGSDHDGNHNRNAKARAQPLSPSQLDRQRPGIERSLGTQVVLDPGEEAVQRVRGHEIHFDSGALYETLGAPTYRAAVRVEAPPELQAEVSFANRGRSEVTEIGGRYVLPTVLLPFQPIVVRWWPKDKHAEWLQRRAGHLAGRSSPTPSDDPPVGNSDAARDSSI